MKTIDISRLLDSRNIPLYEKVKEKYEIKFENSHNQEHSVYVQGDCATFYIPVDKYCVDAFSHELLHVYICYCGVHIGGNFKIVMSQSNILRKILDVGLSEHITNCIEHKLMLPIYVAYGFERSEFLLDYKEFKAEPGVIRQIQINYKAGKKWTIPAVKTFIGKFFAFKCDPNSDFNYSAELQQLQKIDSTLFNILQTYLGKWETYDFTSDTNGLYRSINASFYNGLKTWIHKKEFLG